MVEGGGEGGFKRVKEAASKCKRKTQVEILAVWSLIIREQADWKWVRSSLSWA